VDEPDDLERVLGYVDCEPDAHLGDGEATTSRLIGPDLVVVPFWNERFCRAIVRAAEAVGAFEPQPDDPVPGHEISLAAISPQLYAAVERDLGVRVWPALRQVWPLVDYHGLRDAFVIRYALGEQESLRLHHDVAQVSASVKLNDSYTGGVLEFPRQAASNEGLAVGELLAWPSLVTHPHATTQLDAGVKYALTIWFELPIHLG
jgi:hypothetical protein